MATKKSIRRDATSDELPLVNQSQERRETIKGSNTKGRDKEESATYVKVGKDELLVFLLNVRDKLVEGVATPIYGMAAIKCLMGLDELYGIIDEEVRELARDIWLRLENAGLQLKRPPLLFT